MSITFALTLVFNRDNTLIELYKSFLSPMPIDHSCVYADVPHYYPSVETLLGMHNLT